MMGKNEKEKRGFFRKNHRLANLFFIFLFVILFAFLTYSSNVDNKNLIYAIICIIAFISFIIVDLIIKNSLRKFENEIKALISIDEYVMSEPETINNKKNKHNVHDRSNDEILKRINMETDKDNSVKSNAKPTILDKIEPVFKDIDENPYARPYIPPKIENDENLGKKKKDKKIIDDKNENPLDSENTRKKPSILDNIEPIFSDNDELSYAKPNINKNSDLEINENSFNSALTDTYNEVLDTDVDIDGDIIEEQNAEVDEMNDFSLTEEVLEEEISEYEFNSTSSREPKYEKMTKEWLLNLSDEELANIDLTDEEIEAILSQSDYDDNKPKLMDISKLSEEELVNLDLSEEELLTLLVDEIEDQQELIDDEISEESFVISEVDPIEDEVEAFLNRKNNEPATIFDEVKKTKSNYTEEYVEEYSTTSLNKSFKAKLIQTEGLTQDFYSTIKNDFMSYHDISNKIQWKTENFYFSDTIIGKLLIDNNVLYLFLALDPSDYEDSKFDIIPVFNDSDYQLVPLKFEISSFKEVHDALDLIKEMMDSLDIEKGEPLFEDYHFDYETNEELLKKGLIKKV